MHADITRAKGPNTVHAEIGPHLRAPTGSVWWLLGQSCPGKREEGVPGLELQGAEGQGLDLFIQLVRKGPERANNLPKASQHLRGLERGWGCPVYSLLEVNWSQNNRRGPFLLPPEEPE